jgi:anhydro-N-acetylmuramic acid kinase
MVYHVIGLMSGSSLDGLDIVYTTLEEVRGQWKFDILHADCIPYSQEWVDKLSHASQLSVPDFLKLNTAYGRYTGEQVKAFIDRNSLAHKVHFIASHGHTVFHEPANHTTCQIGEGSTIAAVTGLPVISDLRNMDVALGGQGAPIVPIGDKLLFGNFDYWLNIGGIANITVRDKDSLLAFDICPANQILNVLAEKEGKPFDYEGEMARQGTILNDVLYELNRQDYYAAKPPKSLSNEAAKQLAFPILLEAQHSNFDMLRTMVEHICDQVAAAVKNFPSGKENAQMLVTGGGALNNFLTEQLREALVPLHVNPVVPYEEVAKFKEALVMALIGVLRWREEANVMASVTGASHDSIGGAIWKV